MPQPVKTRPMAKEISVVAGAPWPRRWAFCSAGPEVRPVEGLGPGVNTGLQDDSAPSRETQNSPGLYTGDRQTDSRSDTDRAHSPESVLLLTEEADSQSTKGPA